MTRPSIATNDTHGGAAHRRAHPWPLATAIALFAAMVVVVGKIGLDRTAGHIAYALDDAYIHMALAKNLAVHGVFGATQFEFTAASSSTLWTLLEAAMFRVFGVHDVIPLAMTVVISLALLVVTDRVLRWFDLPDVARFGALFWVVFAAPLAPIVFGGMEHPLQILLDVALVAVAARLLDRDESPWDGLAVMAIVLAALAGWIRYEGIVLVGVVAVAFALRKRFTFAAALVAASVLPAVGWGLVSVTHGGFFLPNPVLVKGSTSAGIGLLFRDPGAYGAMFLDRLPTAYPLYPLVVSSAALLVFQRMRGHRIWSPVVTFPAIAVAISAIHLTMGDVGWFFRYEDYMVVLLGLGLILQLSDLPREWPPRGAAQVTVLVLALAIAFGGVLACARRGNVGLRSTPWAVKNVYDEQYQMAHFLKDNPRFDRVAIGDLGAIAYFNDDLHVLDLEGLAENGVPLDQLGRHRLTTPLIRERARTDGSKIAIVFPDYFPLPPEWVRVGRWTISTNLVNYGPTVEFYAIPPTDPAGLRQALQEYGPKLPQDVRAEIGP